ncbi:hypothetical protein L602_002900000480 [Cupriavidus gilardii J11]|uniref:F-box domain-containing protein n=1 Tax=Cupriavidus gilardii J11 TaxID=936133 RepID=A0A562BGL2_9BURK|nr:hypothetical protein L602_002900000480 [Cupriavidus gilardii J11]
MPFDSLFPIRQQSPFPVWSAAPPLADTGGTTLLPPSIQLDTLPCEILLRIAAWLDGPSVRCLAETSRQIHACLDHDMLAAMRLADRIRWVVTASGFADMAREILERPAAQRAALTLKLAERRAHLHPSLLAGAQRALGTLVPNDDGERLSQALHRVRWRQSQRIDERFPEALPALEHVLQLPDQDRGRVLAQWIAVADKEGVAQRSPAQWQAIVSALPEAAGARVLCKLVKHASTSDPHAWEQIAGNAIDAARNLTPPGNPARMRILRAIAKATGRIDYFQPDGVGTEGRSRRAIWEAVLDLVQTLAPPHQRTLLTGLATYPSWELSRTGNVTVQTHGTNVPAWRKLPQEAAAVLRDTDAIADVLAAMAKDPDRWVSNALPARIPMLTHLMATARQLPDPQCSHVLAMVLHRPGAIVERKDARYATLWNAIFIASAQTDADCQAPLLAKLADTLDHARHHGSGADGHDPTLPSRWLALLDRTMALPESLRLAPARALVHACEHVPRSVGCHQKLLRLALSLPGEADRAELLAAMVDRQETMQPRDWRDTVNQIGQLSGAVREAPVRALVRRLAIRYEAVFMDDETGPADVPAARQTDLPLAAWPRNHDDALRQASAALQWLPLRVVAAELAGVFSLGEWDSWFQEDMTWLLQEARRLPPNGRHEISIVTAICAAMEELCDEEDKDDVYEFLPDVWNAVLALPAHSRGSALAWLADVVERLDIDDPWMDRIREQRQALPEADRPAPNTLKRKEPPR